MIRDLAGRQPTGTRITVLLDCVLGLPDPFGKKGFAAALRSLAAMESKNQRTPFGRQSSEKFFAGLLKTLPQSGKALPTRACEVLARANSVFRTRPFQKNIQTGTYRLWREISRNREEFLLWPFDSDRAKAGAIPVFEGYPSLIWRDTLGEKTRSPGKLPSLLKTLGVKTDPAVRERLIRDGDLTDAAALALGGWIYSRRNLLGDVLLSRLSPSNRHRASREGWIAGLLE
jgi:hypothetical protein